MDIRIEPFNPGNREDFFDFHSRVGGECFCTAWWTPTWEEYAQASAEDNLARREKLLGEGEYDGYLIYADDKVAGWCQVGQRDRLGKVLEQFTLTFEPRTWAITCFQIDPTYQRQGLAAALLEAVIRDLGQRGVKRLEAFPKIDINLPGHQQWTGPITLYEKAGFKKLRDNRSRAVFVYEF
ncbi:MAG: GNAT family N-acetyltransferase [Chloroflexi bacterium]|nr:GNAT family N-acetyltransferase [Chloroflexota bacterium]